MTIICKTCKCPKTRDEFYNSKNKTGHESSCKQCSDHRHYERRRERRLEQGLSVKFPTLANRQLMKEGKKYCPTCKQILNLSEFSTMKVRSGIASHCKNCTNQWGREYNNTPNGKKRKEGYYQKNKERYLDQKLKRRFGISFEQYKKILESQKGKCSICGKTPDENKKMLAVDHNHSTGKNRGLLCNSCNICIGFIEKNKLCVDSIFNYLTTHA
jgi:hypothetical protein